MANSRIIDVWADDLEAEMEHMREVIEKYPFVAIVSLASQETLGVLDGSFLSQSQDTEFPGVVARPMGAFRTSSDYHYQTLRCVSICSGIGRLAQVGIKV